jgi:hypothetical protein
MAGLADVLNTDPTPKYTPKTSNKSLGIEDVMKNISPYTGLSGAGFGDSKYLSNLSSESDPTKTKAAFQGAWSEAANSSAQLLSEILLGTVEGVGYLLDTPDFIYDKVTNNEEQFGNQLSDWARTVNEQFQQEIVPIYSQQDNQRFSEWVFQNIPSLGTAVSLMIPAMGATRGLGILAKTLGGARLAKNAGILKNIGTVAEPISSAIISRQMEGIMEGKEQYDRVFEEAISKGFSEDAAKAAGLKAAQDTYTSNWSLLMMDVMQFSMASKSFSKLSRAKDEILDQAKKKGTLGTIQKYLLQGTSEAGEEGFQFVIGEESSRAAKIKAGIEKDDYSTYGQRLLRYGTDKNLWTSMVFGFGGGVIFEGIGSALSSKDEQNRIQKIQLEVDNYKQSLAVFQNDINKFNHTSNEVLDVMAINASTSGNALSLKNMYEAILENAGGKEENAEIINKANKGLQRLEVVENIVNNQSKNYDPEILGMVVINRLKNLDHKELYTNTDKLVSATLQEVQEGNKLDPTETLLLNTQLELAFLNEPSFKNELNIYSTDVLENKRKELEEKQNLLKDTLKTNSPNYDFTKLDKINVSNLASIKFPNLIADINIRQSDSDFNKYNTKEGVKEVKKEIEKYRKEAEKSQKEQIVEGLNENSTLQELKEIQKISNELGAQEEFNKKKSEVLKSLKDKSTNFNPNNITQSLNDRWKSEILSDEEQGDLEVLMIQNGGVQETDANIPFQERLEKAYKENEKLKKAVDNYFKVLEVPNKEATKPKVNDNNSNTPQSETKKIIDTTWTSSTPQYDFLRDENGAIVKVNGVTQFNLGKPSEFTSSKLINWSALNKGLVKKGDTIYFEYSPNEFNIIKENQTPQRVLIEEVVYLDKNPLNKSSNNRIVVGVLPSVNSKFNELDKYNLGTFRQQLFNDLLSNGGFARTSNFTFNKTSKIKKVIAGHILQNSEYKNPLDVLEQGKKPILGITKRINGKLSLLFNGHPAQDLTLWSGGNEADEGQVYMAILEPNNENYIPHKLFTKKLEELPEVKQAALDIIFDFRTSNMPLKKVLSDLKDYVYVKDIIKKDNEVILVKADGTKIPLEDIGTLIAQVNYDKINKGNYNVEVMKKGYLSTDLNPVEHFHSTTIEIEPISYPKPEITQTKIAVPQTKQQNNTLPTPQVKRNVGKVIPSMQSFLEGSTPSKQIVSANDFFNDNAQEVIGKELKPQPSDDLDITFGKQVSFEEQVANIGKKTVINATDFFGELTKLVNGEVTTPIDVEKANRWLKDNLNVDVIWVNDVINIAKKGGAKAWGTFSNAGITLYKYAPVGTEFHEAFHAVFNLYLTEKEKTDILNEAKQLYNINGKVLTDLELEEQLADDFADYMSKSNRSLPNKILNFFKRLLDSIVSLFNNKITIDKLFERINIGKFKNTQVVIPIINNIVKTKQIPVNQFDTEDLLNLSASNLNPDISNNITITQIDAETGETFQNELPIKDAIVDIKKQSKLLENLLNCTKLS